MSNKIEQLIEEIEEYIDNCKYKALSSTHIIVNKEEIEELLRELRVRTPEEIKRYQKIISNRDAILNDAKEKATTMLNEATVHTNNLISEHEIMQQAYAHADQVVTFARNQAQDILDNATIEANAMRDAAVRYTDERLAEIEAIIARTMEGATFRYQELIKDLTECYETVKQNRVELNPLAGMEELEEENKEEASEEKSDKKE